MRVTGGELRGRRFKGPGRLPVRPSEDRVREAVFSILGDRVAGSTALDLFAGVGSYGIEALSRGAARAVFVESNRKIAAILHANLEHLGLATRSRVVVQDVFRALKSLGKEPARFDLVFADPPYDRDLANSVLTWLSGSVILTREVEVIVEHGPGEVIASRYGSLAARFEKKYGSTKVRGFTVSP